MLKPGVQASLARGLEQWLWFLGVDTRTPGDNLLVRNGFLKFKPLFTRGSSRYRRNWRDGLIELHGYCVGAYSKDADSFIFIRRDSRCFLYTAPRPPWPGRYRQRCLVTPESEAEFSRFHAAATRFLEWLEDYERWVDQTYGPRYREACYEAYHLKWQPPAEGRAWFRDFRRCPRRLEAVKPVVPHLALLQLDTRPIRSGSVPPPIPVSPSAESREPALVSAP